LIEANYLFLLGIDLNFHSSPLKMIVLSVSKIFLMVDHLTLKYCLAALIEGKNNSLSLLL
jgi:hypothetical protein